MIFDLINTILGAAVIGSCFALTFIVPERSGVIVVSKRLRITIRVLVLGWVLSSIGELLATLANLFDTPISDVLEVNFIRSYVTQTTLGRLQYLELIAGLVLLLAIGSIRRVGGAALALAISLAGVVAPLFQSHTSQAGSHGLAIGSLIIHLVALSFWFGAVAGLIFLTKSEQELALPRVANVATWSVVTVILTGAVSSLLRLGFSTDWLTTYGALIIAKLALLGAILVIARQIRSGSARSKLVRIEVSLLVIVMGIGALLSRFTPIVESDLPYDRVRDLVGVSMPAEPNLTRVFFEYEADGLVLGALVFATALYIRGVVALARRGDKWPVGRTISFAVGISLLDYATSGGLGLYSIFSFQYHMMAHMVISMIAPIAIVLGAPITLALRTLPIGRDNDERGLRGWLLAIIHSKYSSVITHPIAALAIFDGSLFALYFTPLFGDLMASHFGHLLMNFHFIAAGLLFFYVIIGVDPNPRRIHHLVRMVLLLAAMSIHAFFSIALMATGELIDGGYYAALERPWATDLLADQKTGAAIGWAMGEIPIVLALVATFIQWMRADRREAKRADRDDRELAEYNEYLEKLARKNQGS